MTVFERLAANWLLSSSFNLFRLSDPDTGPLNDTLRALRDAGYTVLPPGELPSVPLDRAENVVRGAGSTIIPAGVVFGIGATGATKLLEDEGCTVLLPGQEPDITLDQAERKVKASGLVILHPELPPAIGWWDAKPPATSDDLVHPSRVVLSVTDGVVTYAKDGRPQAHTCKIGGFHEWRRKVHATHRSPACEREMPPTPEDAP